MDTINRSANDTIAADDTIVSYYITLAESENGNSNKNKSSKNRQYIVFYFLIMYNLTENFDL